ncbi:hypothetical protein BGZ72_009885 [Mortierella alpina]|nr:hypothetical protein BGZ72_009885 [Mortierella alpina]
MYLAITAQKLYLLIEGIDNEYNVQNANANAEDSPPTKKRKGSKQITDDRRKSPRRRYSSLGENGH